MHRGSTHLERRRVHTTLPPSTGPDPVAGSLRPAGRRLQAAWLAVAAGSALLTAAHGQTIVTVAGTGTPGNTGDGGLATLAQINAPSKVYVDDAGTAYFTDTGNFGVRTVSAGGIIDRVAGNGSPGETGDGGPATQARLYYPRGVFLGPAGDLYIGQEGIGAGPGHRVRRVDGAGLISTFAGVGLAGDAGDGGPAILAHLDEVQGVYVDPAGNVYFADRQNHRVRKVDLLGTISTVAGNGVPGTAGEGTPATGANLLYPIGVCGDAAGNLYIADNSHRIRKVDLSGTISTIAGTGIPGYSGDEGPAVQAQLAYPADVRVDAAGRVYVADQFNDRVRMIDTEGVIHTVAGTGARGYSGDEGPATSADLNLPSGVFVGPSGDLYIVDAGNHRIRKVSAANAPPVADAGPDQVVECTSPSGSQVQLDATASSDPDGDALTFTWSQGGVEIATGQTATVVLDEGAHVLDLSVSDGQLQTQDQVQIEVVDTTPPVLALGGDNPMSIELNDAYDEPGATAVDACDGALSVTASGTVDPTEEGAYAVTYTAVDLRGNATQVVRTVHVVVTARSYSVLALHSLELRQQARIHSGFIGVLDYGDPPFLASGVELMVGQQVWTAPQVRVSSPRVLVRERARIDGRLVTSEPDIRPRAQIADLQVVGAGAWPLFGGVLPAFQEATPGTEIVDVRPQGSRVLGPGSYGPVTAQQRATVTFTGGVYDLATLDLGQQVTVTFQGPTVLRIAERLALDARTTFAPAAGSGLTAADVQVYVGGINGKHGRVQGDPPSVKIGQGVEFQGFLYAPNGSIELREGAVAIGRFIALDVMVGQQVDVYAREVAGAARPAAMAADRGQSGQEVAFGLEQNAPNPFNPSTSISYTLPSAAPVHLVIYNALGQQVRQLVDGVQAPSRHSVTWDGLDQSGQEVSTGLYFYRLEAGASVAVRRMILAR